MVVVFALRPLIARSFPFPKFGLIGGDKKAFSARFVNFLFILKLFYNPVFRDPVFPMGIPRRRG